jgi:uncharacterized protein (TIGR02679 family)
VTADHDRAQAVFGDDQLGWIVDRLRVRLERGRDLDGRLTLTDPTPGQREALDRLLGRRPSRGASIGVDTSELAAVVAHAGLAADLRQLVEAVHGPVRDRVEEEQAERAAWAATATAVRARAAQTDAALDAWVGDLVASGLLRRLGGDPDAALHLGEAAVAVVARLPANGTPLAELAASTLGDSHALDDGTAVATLVLRAIEVRTGLPRRDRSAAERRALWARAGVLLDELSAPALVVGLRPDGDGLLARTLRDHADAGEPARVTLRQLVRHPLGPGLVGSATVAVCENPTVVAAAADRLGPRCAPLVCTEGQPSGAVQTLLRELTEAGVTLCFHVDFDAGGMRIGNLLVDRFGAVPWRMSAADYRRVATRGAPFTAFVPDASWDPELTVAMRQAGRAVHEEQVLVDLLDDLVT